MAQYTPSVTESVSPQSVGRMICVLLHEPETEPSLRLCRALGNKGLEVRTCTDRYAALRMICRTGRETGVTLRVLLLVEPRRLAGVVELVELVKIYAPGAVCWMYTDSPPEQVREVRWEDLGSWHGVEEAGVSPYPAGLIHEPSLRIVNGPERVPDVRAGERAGLDSGDPAREPRRMDREDERRTDPEPVLTDDELSMLLADDLGEHDTNGGHG